MSSATPPVPASLMIQLDGAKNQGVLQSSVVYAVNSIYSQFQLGFNGTLTGAINDTTATVSEFLTDAGAFGGQGYIRMWTTWDLTKQVPQAGNPIYSMALQYAAAGVKVIAVLNLQNCPGKLAPTAAETAAYLTNHPTQAQTGIWAYELGNEVDSATYCA